MCSLGSGMGSPTEHRELMRASFHYSEKRSVEEVLAAQKARHASPSASRGGKAKVTRPPESHGVVRPGALAEMKALTERARFAQGAKG